MYIFSFVKTCNFFAENEQLLALDSQDSVPIDFDSSILIYNDQYYCIGNNITLIITLSSFFFQASAVNRSCCDFYCSKQSKRYKRTDIIRKKNSDSTTSSMHLFAIERKKGCEITLRTKLNNKQ